MITVEYEYFTCILNRHVRHLDDRNANKIYDSGNPNNGGIMDPEHVGKYEVKEEFDLIVYNLLLEDGGIYGCWPASDAKATDANLIVMGEYKNYTMLKHMLMNMNGTNLKSLLIGL